MTGNMEIRPYRDNDLPDVERMAMQTVYDGTVFPFRNLQGVKVSLRRECCAPMLGSYSPNLSLCALKDYWFCAAGKIFVAVMDNKVIGTYVIKPVMPDRMSHVANAGYMIDESVRGRKVGNALAAHSIQTCAKLGYRGMQFNAVVATNHSAIHLWKKHGFVQVGTIPEGFERDDGFVDITIWYRTLTNAETDIVAVVSDGVMDE